MRYVLLICILSLLSGYAVQAQKKKDKKNNKQEQVEFSKSPNAYEPYKPEENTAEQTSSKKSSKKAKKQSFNGQYSKMLDTKVKEFEKRMVAKEKYERKKAKGMEKPQYSNALYFGHKKPPKKRPKGKRKLCKECGIVH
ncbi:MAG: hypothetical protein AAFX87_10755 [Bacteroidota bacterium]